MPEKISLADYFALLLDMERNDQEILAYSKVAKGTGGFDWRLQPDPKRVVVPASFYEQENAMEIGNSICRWRRAERFIIRSERGDDSPVLVSEGDSWFQFPLLIEDTIDQLNSDYRIWSVGAAGDTLENMVFGPREKNRTEYLRALRRPQEPVRAFLFSGAGNDIIGEDPNTGARAIHAIIKAYQAASPTDPYAHIDLGELGRRLARIHEAYSTVIETVRAEPEFADLPIVIHGYDYPFPYPEGNNDPRSPEYAAKDQWLGSSFALKGYPASGLRRDVVCVLIDALYEQLERVAGDSDKSSIWVVNCRGAMPNVSDWNDEIHGNSGGFQKIAECFRRTLSGLTT